MFFKCSFAASLWSRIYTWIKRTTITTSDWENHIAAVLREAKGKTLKAQTFKMVYTETIHVIWMERNQRHFEQKNRDVERIPMDIAITCSARAHPMIRKILQQYGF